MFSNLNGFLLAMYRGPHDVIKYRYAMRIVTPGTGDAIKGQSLVLGSTQQTCKTHNYNQRFNLPKFVTFITARFVHYFVYKN